MKFIDEARIAVAAGAGGNGCLSFRREKFVPRGGPDGGDGGRGGSVVLIGSSGLQTLADLQYHSRYRAERGGHGRGKDMTGRCGEDTLVPVPLGTDVYDAGSAVRLGEVIADGECLVVARGGAGGRGNAAFKTHANVAPRTRELGGPGEERELRLVLRVMSDIGLVGFPNAGKSTILSRLTRASPRIAAYPFTTLTPNLGALENGLLRYTVADLPGIIEGAAQGKGLGLRFLRHIERTRVLVFVIDASGSNPTGDLRKLRAELRAYDPRLLSKRWLLVLNKIDIASRAGAGRRRNAIRVSGLTGEGMPELNDALRQAVSECTETCPG
jgi:GTP-binding protein